LYPFYIEYSKDRILYSQQTVNFLLMMRTKLLLLSCLLGSSLSWAQPGYKPMYPLEIGIAAGTSTFLGDLGGAAGIGRPFLRDTDFKALRPTFGAFLRYNLGANFSARVELSYLGLRGDDAWAGKGFDAADPTQGGDDAFFRYYRNLSFRSRVYEAIVVGEIIPYNFELGGGYQGYSVLSPYALVGFGVFNFRPQAQHDGQWVDLKPLSTEGQGLVTGRAPYKLTQMCVPVGFGVKWSYNDVWAIGLEVNHRITFTDYIDDVSTNYIDPQIFADKFPSDKAALATIMAQRSNEIDPGGVNQHISAKGEQRGDPKDNDSYYTITLRASYFLPPGSFGGGKRFGCPVW
jgi:hypothetical protein